ncbi:DUF3761 domain-containing protein [Solilutibacter silvestris]|uniref:DUF3761 domain-containing protein n=1 Tax=Solilutibacter silvestris TaxID=1645665 RepID=A0A2K1Q0I7_9GAMM|nr:DUF3761 domain-containing protein [Lysobacter silvestris]PNS08551.1 hypothetical protein Lysil_0180 [Lysobacter silvestris]
MKHPILLSLMSLALSAALPAMAQTAAPAGSTGQCKDGSYTSASFKMGACRGHKGVQSWFSTTDSKPAKSSGSTSTKATTASTSTAKPAASAPAAAAATAPVAGASGMCKDGTSTNAASKSGACRGHKGVKEWYGATTAPAAKSAAPAPAATSPTPSSTAATPAPAASSTHPASAASRPMAAGGGNGQVWVNGKDKVYHCQGDQWYGKTKQGQYMSESAAAAAGARPARGKTCGTK